jgi:hypothetical protein
MANTITTTFMGMVLPVPTVETGPAWANEVNAALSNVLDSHDHSAGKGTFVTPAGLSISQDLPMAAQGSGAGSGKNLTLARSVRFDPQAVGFTPLATDRGAIYVKGQELFYVDVAGNVVQLTLTGAVNTSASGAITGMGGTTAAVAYSNASKTFTFTQSATVAAQIDAGSIVIREQVAAGNGVTLKAFTGLAASYSYTLPSALPGQASFPMIDAAGNWTTVQAPVTGQRPTFLGVTLGTTADTTQGNIRWSGTAFEGYRAAQWRELEGWEFLGSTQLGVAGTSITLASIPARDHLMVLLVIPGMSGVDSVRLQFNGDTAGNYSYYTLDIPTTANGGTPVFSQSAFSGQTSMLASGNSNPPGQIEMRIRNLATTTKSVGGRMLCASNGGTFPTTFNIGWEGDWNNTAAQINQILFKTAGGVQTFNIGTAILVFGKNLS